MFNFRRAADYLIYRFKAKTRHGTHSPFVYRLVDKVIYDFSAKKVYDEFKKGTDNQRSTKLNQLIYRLAEDWQPTTIVELGEPLGVTSQYLQEATPDAKIYSQSITNNPDLIFINTNRGEEALNYFNLSLPKVHLGTLLIIDGIYANEEMKQAWAKIKVNPEVTVTIDLFWIGLVYFREGQRKEHFVIKIGK